MSLAPFTHAVFIVFLFATLFANQKKTEAGVYNTFSVFNAGTMVFGFGALGYVPGRMLTDACVVFGQLCRLCMHYGWLCTTTR